MYIDNRWYNVMHILKRAGDTFQFEIENNKFTTLRRPIVLRGVVQQLQKEIGVRDAYAGPSNEITRLE